MDTTELPLRYTQCTTAYHPATNCMVERFHRQLKSSLKCFANPNLWIDALPLVLLGIRTTLKADLNCTSAELVYGVTLRLPGQLFVQPQTSSTLSDPLSYVDHLKEAMQSVPYQPTRTCTKPQHSTFVHKDLHTCTHVFVRRDAQKPPLQPTYDGPFKVIDRKERFFVVALNGNRQDTISIDRLKPAYPIHMPETIIVTFTHIPLNTLTLTITSNNCPNQVWTYGSVA